MTNKAFDTVKHELIIKIKNAKKPMATIELEEETLQKEIQEKVHTNFIDFISKLMSQTNPEKLQELHDVIYLQTLAEILNEEEQKKKNNQ